TGESNGVGGSYDTHQIAIHALDADFLANNCVPRSDFKITGEFKRRKISLKVVVQEFNVRPLVIQHDLNFQIRKQLLSFWCVITIHDMSRRSVSIPIERNTRP